MKKPKGVKCGARTPGWAFCAYCQCKRRYAKDRCKTCGKVIWELQAEINGVALRTTSETYRRLIQSRVDNNSTGFVDNEK